MFVAAVATWRPDASPAAAGGGGWGGSTIGPDRCELLASSVEQGKDGSPHVIPVPGREHLTPARVLIYSKQAF